MARKGMEISFLRVLAPVFVFSFFALVYKYQNLLNKEKIYFNFDKLLT
ncbi:hypothetical protein C414_000260010 [Campylobacter jejuni subsp. jejuni 414]|nr:hypothetical protein C414_000260010 [Campylobacter jejuni subsp. jejuni 414]